eukprot:12894787-Ditylum_brightwellii.AAC.1
MPILTLQQRSMWPHKCQRHHIHRCMALVRYTHNIADPLIQSLCDIPSPTQKALLQYEDGIMASMPKAMEVRRDKVLLEKQLHGVFFKDQQAIPQTDCEQSWR